jgi:hypothetical protein
MPSSRSSAPAPPSPEAFRRLQKLWAEHRALPFPPLSDTDPRAQEVTLYASWLGSLVDAAVTGGGRLDHGGRLMLEVRRREGNQAVWAAAGELGDPARSFVARLLALEECLAELVRVD